MKITILGCGAFGTAIASTFTKKEVNLWIWSKFEKELIEAKKDYKTIKILKLWNQFKELVWYY